jgi:dihydropteroate synthase-like protein
MAREHIHFVTGRLAEYSLRKTLEELAPAVGFDYSIDVLGITVAALMTPRWAAPRIHPPAAATRVMLPGHCAGDLRPITAAIELPVDVGPKDLRELPDYFGGPRREITELDEYDIEIVAEINHAPRLPVAEILKQADYLSAAGANVIDLGCDPGGTWSGVAEVVRELIDRGQRVSIDSFNTAEIAPAVAAGAELVLSVNSSNRRAAADWGCEVVVVPNDPHTLGGLDETIEYLTTEGVSLRIDPVIEPIGFGLAASLGRYLEVRRRYPDEELMMGVGNLTELTDVDSAGVNVLLLGFCQELGIRSVLTTQVINWARSAVRECDLARRLTYHAVNGRVLPKHLEPRLVALRDPKLMQHGEEGLKRLRDAVRDRNFRLFAERGRLHLINADVHLEDEDPFALFDQLLATDPQNLDAGHAFYLGYELAKATTALTLGKQYTQDEALDWGYLTRPESTAGRHARHSRRPDAKDGPP